MPIEAVLFDLDGTLADTAPDLRRVLAAVMAKEGMGAPPTDAIRALTGDGARALIERAFAIEGAALDGARLERLYHRFHALYAAEPCVETVLFSGARAALDGLRAEGLRLGVCTNKPQLPAEALLESLSVLGLFEAVVGGDALPVRKPDPAHVLETLRRLETPPAAAVLVGDNRNDVEAAHAAGLPCIVVPFGYTHIPPAELGGDVLIETFAELADAVRTLRVR